jgi:CDP-4-dehydro-6-deoxyglucose reductase
MSQRIHFAGKPYDLAPGETVLAGLERQGVKLPSFCRTGVCQTCVVRATRGQPPEASQTGIADAWSARGCFLACQCIPSAPLDIEPCDLVGTFASRVARIEPLSPRVLRALLDAPAGFDYRAGQFLQLERHGGVARPYSIASLPGSQYIELHVELIPGGAMSEWLATAQAQPVTVRGPFGECIYFEGEPDRPLLLAGTGTGLAPLLGVVRSALAVGHRAPIHLYHGSATVQGLYLFEELARLAASAPTLRVFGSVLEAATSLMADVPDTSARSVVKHEALDRLLLADPLDFFDCRVYLCGAPEVVQRLRQRVYLSGAPRRRIHCDLFTAPG